MQKNTEIKYFFDSNVFVMAILCPDSAEGKIVFSLPVQKFTNDYVIKEIRRVLFDKGMPQEEINNAINNVGRHVIVLSTPQKHEFQKLEITDEPNQSPRIYAGVVVLALIPFTEYFDVANPTTLVVGNSKIR